MLKRNAGVPRWVLMGCLIVFGLVRVGGGQEAEATSFEAVLVSMAKQAGVIFVGQVVSITRADDQGYVDVSFRVDQGMRGCDGSGWYTVREWVGLWTGQADRYRVGQTSLMLLTAKSAAGFSAPVNGMDGAIPLVANVPPPVTRVAGVIPADATVEGETGEVSADLSLIRMRVVRTLATTAGVSGVVRRSRGPEPRSEAVGVTGMRFQPISDWVGPIAPMPTGGFTGYGKKASEPTLSSVLAVLKGLTE